MHRTLIITYLAAAMVVFWRQSQRTVLSSLRGHEPSTFNRVQLDVAVQVRRWFVSQMSLGELLTSWLCWWTSREGSTVFNSPLCTIHMGLGPCGFRTSKAICCTPFSRSFGGLNCQNLPQLVDKIVQSYGGSQLHNSLEEHPKTYFKHAARSLGSFSCFHPGSFPVHCSTDIDRSKKKKKHAADRCRGGHIIAVAVVLELTTTMTTIRYLYMI